MSGTFFVVRNGHLVDPRRQIIPMIQQRELFDEARSVYQI